MDFLQGQILLYTSKKYEEIYMLLNSKYGYKYQQLFLFCASLGASQGKKTALEARGRETRSNYLTNDERALAYSIIINDENNGKDIQRFNDKEYYSEARSLLEEYAEGGMDILVAEVFKEKWNGIELDPTYDNYMVDLLKFVYQNIKKAPF